MTTPKKISDSDRKAMKRMLDVLNSAKIVLGERSLMVLDAQQAQAKASQAVAEAAQKLEARLQEVLTANGIPAEEVNRWGVDLNTGELQPAQPNGQPANPAPMVPMNRTERRRTR
jgi:hypothetical protein